MVLVTAPSICLLVFFLIGLGDAGKKQKNDQIIIHVPYKIHHHHYPPQVKYVKVPEIKTEIFPEETLLPELTNPILKFEEPIAQTELPSLPVEKKRKQKKLKKIFKRKPKTTSIPPHSRPSPQSFPLETFLGLDKILGDQIKKQQGQAPIAVRLPSKPKAQPKDYSFSDGTDFEVKKPKQLAITSYAFTTMGHGKPQPVLGSSGGYSKNKSERSLDDNPDYEHVGYILIPKNQNAQVNRDY